MPIAAPKPCIQCGALVRDGTSRCRAHKTRPGTFADKRRGSRHERGYGTAWDRTREHILARDGGLCDVDLELTDAQRQAVRDAALGACRHLAREHGVRCPAIEVQP